MPCGKTKTLEITQLPAHVLARRIAAGDVSAVETIEAHIERIECVDRDLGAVVVRMQGGVVPATRVSEGEETTGRSRDGGERSFARIESGSAGLPVGIHVAASWWREDRTLAVMKRLEHHFRGTAEFPLTPVSPA